MKITCAWAWDPKDPDSMPWLAAAFDEYTFEAWGKTPDFYHEDIKKTKGEEDSSTQIRECVIDVPDSRIEDLFKVPWVAGFVKPLDSK